MANEQSTGSKKHDCSGCNAMQGGRGGGAADLPDGGLLLPKVPCCTHTHSISGGAPMSSSNNSLASPKADTCYRKDQNLQ